VVATVHGTPIAVFDQAKFVATIRRRASGDGLGVGSLAQVAHVPESAVDGTRKPTLDEFLSVLFALGLSAHTFIRATR
jgi:hypothetical protein